VKKHVKINFASLLWEFRPEDFSKKTSRASFLYLEQLWFYEIFSVLNILGGDSFLARNVETRQISEAKNMFFWVLKAFRRFSWQEMDIQKCSEYFFTPNSVLRFNTCPKLYTWCIMKGGKYVTQNWQKPITKYCKSFLSTFGTFWGVFHIIPDEPPSGGLQDSWWGQQRPINLLRKVPMYILMI